MKKFLTTLMLMIVFLIPVAQAEILEPGFTASYAAVSHDVTPGLSTASASILMERCCDDHELDNNGTPGDQDHNSSIASISAGSGGVSGGGTIGVIRS